MQRFLGCDWGTTNLRAWVIGEDGKVVREQDFALGVSKLQPGEAAQRFRDEVRPAMAAENLPALLCGMIGSTLGWTVAPYVDTPARLPDLARALVEVDPGVRIVPGLRGLGLGAPEVMRGEETQLFGWARRDEARQRGRHLVCHPGTHAKWALIEDGSVGRFLTSMTGELYAVLGRHSVLRFDGAPDDPSAFEEGLDAAGEGDALATRLFTARTRLVAANGDPATAASYLSGLLIGAEVAALPRLLGAEPGPIGLVGAPDLCRWYEVALVRRGFEPQFQDGEQAAISGLVALQELIDDT